MASSESRDTEHTTVTDDHYSPTDLEGNPLSWDGNYAKILGLIHEVGKYLVRKGLLQPFIKHRAVALNNGRTSVYSMQSVPFIQGLIADSDAAGNVIVHDFDELCPAINERVRLAVDGRAARGETAFTFPTTLPGPDFTVNPLACDQEDGKLLRVLASVFGHTEESEELLDVAAGSGVALHAELRRLAATASTADIAVVSATFDQIKSSGVSGELTLASLKSFLKAYRRAKADLAPNSRPPPGSEVEMINLIAFRDSSLREIYELKTAATPPATLDAAVRILNDILTSRARAEQLEQVASGPIQAGLAAPRVAAPLKPSSSNDITVKMMAMLSKIESKMGTEDPNKETETGEKKTTPPSMVILPPGLNVKESVPMSIPTLSNQTATKFKLRSAGVTPETPGRQEQDEPGPSLRGQGQGPRAHKNKLKAGSCPSAALGRVTSQGGSVVDILPYTPGLPARVPAGDAARTAPFSSACPTPGSSPPSRSTSSNTSLHDAVKRPCTVEASEIIEASEITLQALEASCLKQGGGSNLRASKQSALASMLEPLLIRAVVDSGCTGHVTPHESRLVNVKACNHRFKTANGKLARATCIGDMPVLGVDKNGARVSFVVTGVRCVPDFKFTLLSVDQLWESQRFDARFADVRALTVSNDQIVPFAPRSQATLPTIRLVSAAVLASAIRGSERIALVGSVSPAAKASSPPPVTPPVSSACKSVTDFSVTGSSSTTRPTSIHGRSASSPAGPSPAELPSRAAAASPPLLPTPRAASADAPLSTSPPRPTQSPPPTSFTDTALQPANVEDAARPHNASTGVSSRPLGWHSVGSSSHVAKLASSQAAELLHRRSHRGIDKIRALPHTTTDAPKVLASANAVCPCDSCAQANIKRKSHSGSLSAPAPEPGVLHFDLKEMVVSIGGFRYIVFLIDEHSRYVFYDYIKLKSEAQAAVQRCIAAFEATVGTRVDPEGRPLPRPRVRELHSDREGKLMSYSFKEFRAKTGLHFTVSPPHDHDLNPIAERIIGLIAETATAIRINSSASPRHWPWIISYAVDWHNSTISSVGSSTADATISPHQRFTLRPPQVMDLPAFGCRAVAWMPPNMVHKPSLSGRGLVGIFLGRSRNSKGAYDVEVKGRVVTSSSVLVNEEYFDWAPSELRHRPLTSKAHAASLEPPRSLPPSAFTDQPSASSFISGPTTHALLRKSFLNLFSGPYARADGLTAAMKAAGWLDVVQIDNDGEKGGGWGHDLLNDTAYAKLLADAKAGKFSNLMMAFPCSTFSISRFFDASTENGGDRGPPVIRDFDNPDGLPENSIDPKHVRELKLSNLLLMRTVEIATAARKSPARTTLIFENPADRSPGASVASAPEFAKHGSIFRTTAFKRLVTEADLTGFCTFAYCRLGSERQKYTSLAYTPEAGSVLDELNSPDFQCNHERGAHAKRAGGRGPDGNFISAEAAPYPPRLCHILARAFTVARTGGDVVPASTLSAGAEPVVPPSGPPSHLRVEPDPPIAPTTVTDVHAEPVTDAHASQPSPSSQSPWGGEPRGGKPVSPVAFPALPRIPRELKNIATHGEPRLDFTTDKPPVLGIDGRAKRATSQRLEGFTYSEARPSSSRATRQAPPPTPRQPLDPVSEQYSPGGTASDAYSPFVDSAASTMEGAAAAAAFDAFTAAAVKGMSESELLPISNWSRVESIPRGLASRRLPGGARVIEIDVALSPSATDVPTDISLMALLASVNHALRADSPDAPATHAEAMKRGHIWVESEGKELDNHKRNESWETITVDELPPGRRVHKLIWVYKVKRDGTAKSRLCVQGSTLEAGVDYQQVFSAALRHSSARALFALAARLGCGVRSVDLVAAYLQGRFVEGEVVYTHLPVGYPEFDAKGRPKLAKIKKPIYGIQQAGRRLQRMLFEWLREQGFKPLDDSDPCIFSLDCPNGEVLKVGVYVDNLQIVHSVSLGASGRGPEGCAYNSFMDKLSSDWDVTDEGPMEDLLGIEVEYNADGSIKLHQRKYIEKIVERFLPNGPLEKCQRNSLPHSEEFLQRINDALSRDTVDYPELVKPMQERTGCLMYATTSTRPDIAYVVSQLCKCMHKPTPELIAEIDHLLSYLARTADLGLTYSCEQARLSGFADASWEVKHSTSGWLVKWQSAAISWGSRKQKSIALSSCEAEIIALSEAAKDVVYLRKLVKGLDAPEPGPTQLASDSKSARDVSYNPEHHDRMKHVERRHYFVRDMVEAFELEVPFVRTHNNLADLLTKPMKNATRFRELRNAIMNIRED